MVGSELSVLFYNKRSVHDQDHLSTENQKYKFKEWSLPQTEDPNLFSLMDLVRDKMSGQFLKAPQVPKDLENQLVRIQLWQSKLPIN